MSICLIHLFSCILGYSKGKLATVCFLHCTTKNTTVQLFGGYLEHNHWIYPHLQCWYETVGCYFILCGVWYTTAAKLAPWKMRRTVQLCLNSVLMMYPTRSKRSLEKKEEPVPSPSMSGLQRTPKAEHQSRKRTASQSSTSLSSGTGSGKEGSHSTKGNSTSKHKKEDKGRSSRDGKVGLQPACSVWSWSFTTSVKLANCVPWRTK